MTDELIKEFRSELRRCNEKSVSTPTFVTYNECKECNMRHRCKRPEFSKGYRELITTQNDVREIIKEIAKYNGAPLIPSTYAKVWKNKRQVEKLFLELTKGAIRIHIVPELEREVLNQNKQKTKE